MAEKKTPIINKNSRVSSLNPKSKKFLLIPLVAIIALALIGIGAYYFINLSKSDSKVSSTLTPEESQRVIAAIGKLIELPEGEEPILATVTDLNLLKSEPFYDKAQNGDRVLIYKNSSLAILYRPSSNKIIKVGAVALDESTEEGSPSASSLSQEEESQTVTVAIYNGTSVAGFAKTTGDSLTDKFENIEIVETANSAEDYTKTIVVNLSGKNKSAADSLAKELEGTVEELPEEEEKPSADILIILGQAQ